LLNLYADKFFDHTGWGDVRIQGSSIPTPAMHEAFKNCVDQNPS